jgi:ubiquinone biosynthesis protein
MERIDGIRIDDLVALDAASIDRPALARRAAEVILTEVFEHGLFHADPHPGNFAVQSDGRIVAYDFGMVGRLNPAAMRALMLMMAAVIAHDPDRVIDEALNLDIVRGKLDRQALRRDISRVIDRYAEARISEINVAEVIGEMYTLIRRHHLRLPADLALLTKTLAMHESAARRLDPTFTPIEIASPFAHRALVDRYRPSALGPRLVAGASDSLDLFLEGPRRLDRLLAQLERGNVEVSMRVSDWERMLVQLQGLVNRLVVAWLTSASLISLAVLLAIYRPGWIEDWLGPLFWLGAAVTVSAGGILLLTVLRRRL